MVKRIEHELLQQKSWHTMPIDQVLSALESDVDGLSDQQASERLGRYGLNKLEGQARTSRLLIFLRQFKDPLIYLLLLAGVATTLLQDFTDAIVIFSVVLLNAIIGLAQEHKAEESILALKKLLALKAFVIRNGVEQYLDAELIVPGDIVLLQSGQKVPADIRLMQTKEFQVQEAAFTGESEPVFKLPDPIPQLNVQTFEMKNVAFMGSVVASGRATGIAIATGVRTQLGLISEEVRAVVPEKTPLQSRVETLSRYIIFVTIGFSFIGLLLGLARGEDILQLVLAIIAMAVAVIPEGLPVALTIALAVSVRRMARRNAIIRHLPAIETIGSSTAIGSDKTGTLTRNEMSVQQIWAGGITFHVEGAGYSPHGFVRQDSVSVDIREHPLLAWVLRVGLLANESSLIKEEGTWKALGDPTEVALLVSAIRAGLDEERESFDYPQLDIVPFESDVQYMATLNSHGDASYLMAKGAPERLLSLSTRVASENESVEILAQTVIDEANTLADQGLRVLGMAYKMLAPSTKEITHNDIKDLTFAGLQGMIDPPRPEAITAVNDAKESGIRVLMITGDNERTALSVGKMVGITSIQDKAITGRELESIGDNELKTIVKSTQVFARVSPQHKLRIVNALKANGEIVAVTGDGVNDAAALKTANIGIAMGITGTDVAKEASDMVVTDDNFASIYSAIIEGRVAFDNIRKVTYFLLTTGLGMLIAVFASIATAIPLILLPAQILWVNLVTNGFQDVALAFDPKEPGVEQRPPRDPKEGVLNRVLSIRMIVLGLFVAASTLGVFLWELQIGYPLAHARTMALTTVVFSQFFHVLNSRSETMSVFIQNPLRNRILFASMIAAIVAQLTLTYLPFMQIIFRSTALTASEFLIAIGAASLVLIGSELDKWRLRHTLSSK